MARYKIKYNPTTGLPLETKLYTLWRIEEFLDTEYDLDLWEDKVGDRYNRKRAVILYSLRECERDPQSNRHHQLENTCRKYWKAQPEFWPRFLREKYPLGQINDFFDIPYDDMRAEFYEYESFARENGLDPSETGRIFDIRAAVEKLKTKMVEITESWDMEKAPVRPVVLYDDDPPLTSNPELLSSHIEWLESRGVHPAIIRKTSDACPQSELAPTEAVFLDQKRLIE